MKKWMAVSELLLATVIWGFGFIATIWALQSIDPISLNVLRFIFAAVIGLAICVMFPQLRQDLTRKQLLLAAAPGACLGLAIGFQTWGLVYTTATNSGFITTLYVVLVPLCELLILKRNLHPLHNLWVLLALVGTALIVNFQLTNINNGDALTLICAFFAAVQIILLGAQQKKINSPFVFNTFQSLWAAIATLPLFFFAEKIHISNPTPLACIGFFSIVVGSSVFAFFLQVKAQKVLSPSLASLVFLLESPFAVLFAYHLLNEKMTWTQALGAVIIFISAAGATGTEIRQQKKQLTFQ